MNPEKVGLADEIGGSHAEHFVDSRADVSELPSRVKYGNHVREAGDQMADEFLFLM